MGKPKYIESPEKFRELFEEYKVWAKSNPYKKHIFVGKDGREAWELRERPLTWIGFEVFLSKKDVMPCGKIDDYLDENNPSYEAYLPIARACKAETRQDIIEGGASGIYEKNISARLAGLVENTKTESKVIIEMNGGETIST